MAPTPSGFVVEFIIPVSQKIMGDGNPMRPLENDELPLYFTSKSLKFQTFSINNYLKYSRIWG